MFVSHYPRFSIFSPYSMSYSVHISFFTFFTVSPYFPGPTVYVSHFASFYIFLVIFQVLPWFFSFSSFVSVLDIFKVLQCVFLICYVLPFSWNIPGPTVYISHFSRFLVLLAVFLFLPGIFLIVPHFSRFSWFSPYSRSYSGHFSFFTFFSVSRHIPGHTVFVFHFPHFSIF